MWCQMWNCFYYIPICPLISIILSRWRSVCGTCDLCGEMVKSKPFSAFRFRCRISATNSISIYPIGFRQKGPSTICAWDRYNLGVLVYLFVLPLPLPLTWTTNYYYYWFIYYIAHIQIQTNRYRYGIQLVSLFRRIHGGILCGIGVHRKFPVHVRHIDDIKLNVYSGLAFFHSPISIDLFPLEICLSRKQPEARQWPIAEFKLRIPFIFGCPTIFC